MFRRLKKLFWDLGGVLTPELPQRRPARQISAEVRRKEAAEALAGDFEKVGGDLQRAIDSNRHGVGL